MFGIIPPPKKAVTLIEVLMALIVFGIWILTILRLLTENSRWIYDIKSKDVSVLLAKEWIEIAYHMRDSNKEKDMFWNCARVDTWALNSCGDYFYEWGGATYYLATWDMQGTYQLSWITSTWLAVTTLYLHDTNIYDASWTVIVTWWTWYNHQTSWWTATIYSRYLKFTPVSGYVNDTWFILQVESHVTYTRGGRSRDVVLESLIGEIR